MSLQDVKSFSDEQLEVLRIDLHESLTSIRDQIDKANLAKKEHGVTADTEWYRNVNVASRMKGMQYQQVLQEIAERKRAEKHQTVAECFVEVAREELDPQDYREMMAMAHERHHADLQMVG